MKEENNKLTPLYKANISEVKKKTNQLRSAIKKKILENREKNEFKVLDQFREEILVSCEAGLSQNEIVSLFRDNLKLTISTKQLSDYLKECLKIKRFGGNGGKLAYIDEEGNLLKYVEIDENSIRGKLSKF